MSYELVAIGGSWGGLSALDRILPYVKANHWSTLSLEMRSMYLK